MRAVESPAGRAYLESPMPPDGAPWLEVDFTVIDLETTGLDHTSDEIVSFATVTVSGGRVTLADAQYELIRPDRMPDADTVRIHGLREADLADAAPLSDRLDQLLAALAGRALVAHVAAIERGFLGAALASRGLELRNPLVDTAAMDRELRRLRRSPAAGSDPIGLSDLARSLGLPVHRPHHADGDALTTAQAFIALATHLEAFRDPLTLRSLENMGDGPRRRGRLRSLLHRFGLGVLPA
jgi:DNA polymerase III subunit epsilon